MKKIITVLAVFGMVFALAPAAQADTVFLTDSDQLHLAGRDVLAAANFWDAERTDNGASPGPGQSAVGFIQGTDFSDHDDEDTVALMSVAQGTLSMPAPKPGGRENFITLTGPDATEAVKLGNAGWFTGGGAGDLDLTFDFGAEYANKEVEVQLIGGGTSANSHLPRLDVSVGGDPKGTFICHDGTSSQPDHTLPDFVTPTSGNPYLMSFFETLDANGDIHIDVDLESEHGTLRDIHFRAAIVTVVPAADGDTDGDGMSDGDEIIADTNPLDSNSYLWVQVEVGPSETVRRLMFPSSSNRVYRVESRTNLNAGAWVPGPTNIPGTGGMIDLFRTNGLERVYYRVGVERP